MIQYQEYFSENGDKVDSSNLAVINLDIEEYKVAHRNLIIVCHDVFILYKGGILLVKRKNYPDKGIYWPIGGRIKKGITTEESLKQKAMEECNLCLDNITYIGTSRTVFKTDPFGHGRGTDTINLIYTAKGTGDLILNESHSEPIIVTKANYKKIRDSLHPFTQDILDQLFKIKGKKLLITKT
ncbi:MAG: NUDIX domain-containing protein [Patescibacteria group bacterium]|nr:NUDIX domain-containing protein [Patescibacteria group bacterium]MCL5093705.1 NUDIX domain-containing protein [Patescibacteria group bacterium]